MKNIRYEKIQSAKQDVLSISKNKLSYEIDKGSIKEYEINEIYKSFESYKYEENDFINDLKDHDRLKKIVIEKYNQNIKEKGMTSQVNEDEIISDPTFNSIIISMNRERLLLNKTTNSNYSIDEYVEKNKNNVRFLSYYKKMPKIKPEEIKVSEKEQEETLLSVFLSFKVMDLDRSIDLANIINIGKDNYLYMNDYLIMFSPKSLGYILEKNSSFIDENKAKNFSELLNKYYQDRDVNAYNDLIKKEEEFKKKKMTKEFLKYEFKKTRYMESIFEELMIGMNKIKLEDFNHELYDQITYFEKFIPTSLLNIIVNEKNQQEEQINDEYLMKFLMYKVLK